MKIKKVDLKKNKYIMIISIIFLAIILLNFIDNQRVETEISKNHSDIERNKLTETASDYAIKYLEGKSKYAEVYLIQGYNDYNENKLNSAKEYLIRGISNIKESTNYLTKTYIYKYLAMVSINQCNYIDAKKYIVSSFESIEPKYYEDSIDIIIDLSEICQETKPLRNVGIEILEIVDKSETIRNESRLLVEEELSLLYFINNEYSNSSEKNIDYIILAQSIDKNMEYAKGMIHLATLFNEIQGNKTAIEIIKEALIIDIPNKKEEGIVRSYGYLNLGEIYADLGMYGDALTSISKIDEYKKYYSQEDYRDYEILMNLVKARCYINMGRLEEAKLELDKSKKLLNIDKDVYFIDKQIEYNIVNAQYYVAKKDYDCAIIQYEELLDEVKDYGNLNIQQKILEDITDVYKITGDNEKYVYYTEMLIEVKGSIQDVRYKDYSTYIIQSTMAKRNILSGYKFKVNMYRFLLAGCAILIIMYYIISRKMSSMRHLSQRDGLTGVYNRRQFDRTYESLVKKTNDFACILLDIDNFKSINDTYGHAFGDDVIIKTVTAIEDQLRNKGQIYRYGGEEFAILINKKNIEDVVDIAQRCRVSVNEIEFEEDVKVSVSMGVATFRNYGENVIEKADEYLYEAKKTGKNKVVYKI